MLKLHVIGNLGGDAELKSEGGRQFVSFRVAHTIRRTRDDGTAQESTEWISCSLNGDGGALMQYLKRGVKVFISGDVSVRQYHSERDHCLKAGLNCYVRELELISTNVDAVPRDLYDHDGVAHQVAKFYAVQDIKKGELYDRQGRAYTVDNGWVSPVQPAPTGTTTEDVKQTTDEVY